MQIQVDYSNINRYKNNYITNVNKNNISFEGLNFNQIFSNSKSSAISERSLKEYTYQISSFLGLKFDEIAPKIKGLNKKSKDFLEALSIKYSNINFNRSGNLKEDPMLVFEALQNVNKPQKHHYKVLSEISNSFEYISKIFSAAQDKKSMEFVLNFHKNFLKNDSSGKNILIEMLNSPFKKQYMENIDDFKSYILLNRKNPEAVKELDLLMQNNHYDRNIYDIRLSVNNIIDLHGKMLNGIISKDNLTKYYSESSIEFLDNILYNSYRKENKLSSKNELDILAMYKSTNRQNIDARLSVIKKFKYILQNNKEENNPEISYIKQLFELMDSDKYAMRFINKFTLEENTNLNSVSKLIEILNELSPQKADIFSDNIFRIIKKVKNEELIPTLKEQYNNPFFETKTSKYNEEQMIMYGFKSPESRFSRIKRTIQNKINEFKYSISEKQSTKISNKINTEQPIVQEKTVLKTDPVNLEHTIINNNETPIKLVNKIKKSPNTNKLKLIGEVNDYISKILSKKTLEEQSIVYGKKATKMRLKMLPEIFNSIKETRQADRAVGKLKSNSSNKDAIELYKLINGSNRKYIKYLLEKRNVDGTRMFEVKDIIAMVEKANKRITDMKKANPDFRAKDAKAYFDHLYDSKIEQYGKVKKTKKK